MEEIKQLNRKTDVPKPTDLNYRIGLDIGIASVGWAVLENDSHDEPFRIIDLGVRIFDAPDNSGELLSAKRREARSTRRRTRRRGHRLERIKKLFETEGLIDIEEFETRYKKAGLPDVYRLRYEGLDRVLTDDELAQVLLHIAKHRGFKSNSKAEETENDSDATKKKEIGAIKESISANKRIMEEKGYRTVGEMLYLDEKFKIDCDLNTNGYIFCPRNKRGEYKVIILRDVLVDEVHKIFESQRKYGNESASDKLEKKYLDIFLSQRSFDQGLGYPSKYALDGFDFGKCPFEEKNGERRAPKAAYTSELFVALQTMNHTKIVDTDGNKRAFTELERKKIIQLFHIQNDVKYSEVRKELALTENEKFYNLTYSKGKKKDSEQSIFIKMTNYHNMAKALKEKCTGEILDDNRADLYDKIAYNFARYKNDDSRLKELRALGIGEAECNDLLKLSCNKAQGLSLVAMNKIIPFLLEGRVYSEACKLAGYGDFVGDNCTGKSILLRDDEGQKIKETLNEITNPVVRRAVSQTIKVINAIIIEYGSPQAVSIELSREMAKNKKERDKIDKDMEKRCAENAKILDEIREFKAIPTGKDIVKYRLWKEQREICLYTGKKISAYELFSGDGGYDIDHILPYSKTFDDSYRNKVLVRSEANRLKGNRTPYEYLISHGGEKDWEEFTIRVEHCINDYKKRQKLLKKTITDEDTNEFKRRNLQDTQYATTFIYNLIRKNLYLKPYQNSTKKKTQQVMALNGSITSFLSRGWGLEKKDRRTHIHHAQDAVVIACTTQGMINSISEYFKYRESKLERINRHVKDESKEKFEDIVVTREQYDKQSGKKFPLPWQNFKEELDIRMARYNGAVGAIDFKTSPLEYLMAYTDVSNRINYPEWMFVKGRPGRRGVLDGIFVSRMPNHKVSGQAHKETIRSAKYYKEGGGVLDKGYVVYKVPIQDIKYINGEIIYDKNAVYFNPDSDRLLYNALISRLEQFNGNAKEAFLEPFYKPKADGTSGPVVKKIKVCEKQTSGVPVGENGIASNGDMVRIDVFCEENKGKKKYYFVPIYVSDVVKKRMPNRAATQAKIQSEWREMREENFIFSLYSKDLIYIESDKGVPLHDINKNVYSENSVFAYYTGANISKASIDGECHDKKAYFDSLGIQGLRKLEKCQVDVLGNISFVHKEKRMLFN